MTDWTTRASYYKIDLDNEKLFIYMGWTYITKDHWNELVRWVKSGNVVSINNKVYFNEKKLRYDLEDTPKYTTPNTRWYRGNSVSIKRKEWVL